MVARRVRLPVIVVLAALACLLFCSLDSRRHSSSSAGFVLAPGASAGRRQALSALLPVSTVVAAAAPAMAEEVKDAKVADAKVTDVKFEGGSFTLPADMKFDQVKLSGQVAGSRTYSQKDKGAVVYVGPTWDLKKIANDIAAPSFKGPPGLMWKNFKLTDTQDDMEYVELAMSDTQMAEAPYTYVIGGKSRETSTHYWMRNLRQNGKSAVIVIALPLETLLPIDYKKQEAETKAMQAVLNSFTL